MIKQLNKNIPVPLYFQLKQQIIEQLETRELNPGDPIPSERELSELYEISRMTVRQALHELVNEGRLKREQGKGTFVAKPKISQGLFKLTSFSEDMILRGMHPDAYVVNVTVEQAKPSICEVMQIKKTTPVLILTRVRLADSKPMALETTHLSLNRFPNLDKEQFDGVSLYSILQNKYNTVPFAASQTIEAGMPTANEVHLLETTLQDPVMLIERVTRDEEGNPFEFVKSVYPGDRYKFHSDLLR
ncbi:GntR family transcriptional regulator [Paenibacillus nasutitermitis]|uniref:HTH-type transcriptional repressor DasR n=1 Tax=Paenibacillus nasutitermitis TaxID=1652958 RepID=A0A916Z6K9_9BACL|nr:GntR family transcriptional regulator [Paenibacillus nasutitermitis]GGD77324.1 HTH-type transcriptional repressor DasR [Paenibacillus nasutitermitis]